MRKMGAEKQQPNLYVAAAADAARAGHAAAVGEQDKEEGMWPLRRMAA